MGILDLSIFQICLSFDAFSGCSTFRKITFYVKKGSIVISWLPLNIDQFNICFALLFKKTY